MRGGNEGEGRQHILALRSGHSMRRSQTWRTQRSRTLRANETATEAKLWAELRNRHFAGLKFVRQSPVGGYFADFLCRERCLIVEVDGATHSTDAELSADALRTRALERLGYRIFRASNTDIFDNLDGVLDALLEFIEERPD